MSITFCIEAHSDDRGRRARRENAPTLNVHNTGGWTLLAALGIDPDHYGDDRRRRPARPHRRRPVGPIPEHPGLDYVVARLPRLRDVAVAAHRLGRQVVWG